MGPNIYKLKLKNGHSDDLGGSKMDPKSPKNGVGRVPDDTIFRAIFAYLWPKMGTHIDF